MKWLGFLQPSINSPVPAIEKTGRSIALAGQRIDYLLIRKRGRRGVGLKIDGHGMSVSTSLSTPIATVEEMIATHERWVLKKLAEWSKRRVAQQSWANGETILFLGAPLQLKILTGVTKANVEQIGDALHVQVKADSEEAICKAVIAWYKKQALPHLAQRAFLFAKLHGLTPPQVFLSSANGRWGSCNSRREVRLSWRLMKARSELIDYVVCHELAHLRHMNHSAHFWAEVERMCPDYRQLKDELDKSDHMFRAF